jgi:hypothetical protein
LPVVSIMRTPLVEEGMGMGTVELAVPAGVPAGVYTGVFWDMAVGL